MKQFDQTSFLTYNTPLQKRVFVVPLGYSAQCADSYLNEDELESLHEYVEVGRIGTIEEIMNANERFHEIIVKASHNPVMIDIIDPTAPT
ncbi:FCD domain-containing protein [Bacillus atrophaeus]|uniref:FCD domain-containing protein n=1 Tax=Bacillus atrophaeus TaxID=1452 RepID=UPI00228271CE|nr:FCD domain-containing protein [Bacillus atrophaeus]MCY8512225.1 FCD domain-containing protein [Bacillus atrophaeus]MCY8993088.1 FCD domain-containing protein [Bacillus atrophaeus]